MSYTINPNAKNKWARNAENTMDLSLETDASSVYLENGRTLEQEIGEGSMVSNVATVDSAMSKVIDGTLDGAYESCVFKGQTLVNLIGEKREYINRNSKLYGWEFMLPYNLTSGKTYLAIFDVSGTIDESNSKVYLMDNGFESTSGNVDSTIPTFSSGHNVVKCIATNNIHKVLRIRINYNENEKFTVSNVMLIEYQEGMENWDIPYFEGICDVKMPILHNVGKNLFDGNLEDGAFNSSGIPVEYENRKRTGFIKIKQGETYTISGCTIARWCFYTPEKEFITTNTTQTTKPAPMDGYIRFSIQTNFTHDNIQLEESSSATSYEDYKTNILHTPETVTLRSLPSDVRDELNLKTGEYIKRIGEIMLDGSEDGWSAATTKEKTQVFQLEVVDNMITSVNGGNNYNLYCDKLEVGSGADKQLISFHNNNIFIALLKENASTVEELKKYLQQNPITVQYELKTPITTTIEPLSIPFAYKNGHIVLESGFEGQSLLPTLEYSTVINRTGQIQSIANTIQKQEKQITKLEQMLIQNIIDLDYNNTLLTLKNEMEEML